LAIRFKQGKSGVGRCLGQLQLGFASWSGLFRWPRIQV